MATSVKSDEIFREIQPSPERLSPIIVSCPHVGTQIPPELSRCMDPTILKTLPDTDWYVDQLYDFAPEMGITVLAAQWSRYVVDLNRDPADLPLYQDGRTETGLFPNETFSGLPLYPSEAPRMERAYRLSTYYKPYHNRLKELIHSRQKIFGQVLLWEAHSIARQVSRIQKNPFADLMVGDSSGLSCSPKISQTIFEVLSKDFHTVLNSPFKGGYITRHYSAPSQGIHTVQLEMSQDLYLSMTPQGSGPASLPTMSTNAERLISTLEKVLQRVNELLMSR
jgi:N-formylglutamate amidohydrolase